MVNKRILQYPMLMSVIGVDVGGTKIALARREQGTHIIEKELTIATDADAGFADVYARILSAIQTLRTDDVTGVGMGVPGLLRKPEGIIARLPNIPGAENFPLLTTLKHDLKLAAAVENDANCFALAEATFGSGRGHDIVVGIIMGTGVGGGIVMNGTLFHGHHGFAGEIGHMLLMPGETPYETEDKRGDVEQFLSGKAFKKRSQEDTPASYLDDPVLKENVIKEAAQLCASLTHLLDPSIIIFGGSAGLALKPSREAIVDELSFWVLPDTPLPELAIGELSQAGVLGASLLIT